MNQVCTGIVESGATCVDIFIIDLLKTCQILFAANHLDLEACVWLEEYLKSYNRILVIVSHSQDFLNGVCTNIIQ